MAGRHVLVAVAASAIIAGSAGYAALDTALLEDLQVRWNQRGSFGYMSMLNGGIIEVCNPAFMPLSFHGVSISASYRGQDVGTFVTGGATVPPGSGQELAGRGQAAGAAGRMFSMYVDTEMTGADMARVDAGQIDAVLSVDTAVFGAIPWSITKTYSGQEFFDMMNGGGPDYAC